MEQESKGIRWQSENRRKVQNLMHLVNEETLREEHQKQSGWKAVGVDGVTKEKYGEHTSRKPMEVCGRWGSHYNTKAREGKYRLGVRTSKKKLKAKKRAAKAWLKAQRNKPVSVCLARGTGDGRRSPGIGVQPRMPNNPKLL